MKTKTSSIVFLLVNFLGIVLGVSLLRGCLSNQHPTPPKVVQIDNRPQISSGQRLQELDETYGERKVSRAKNFGRLGEPYVVYNYVSVPNPLKAVTIALDGDKLAGVSYIFGTWPNAEQLNAGAYKNGTGWASRGNGIGIDDFVSKEGHWLRKIGYEITVYFDGRIQLQEEAARKAERARNVVPKM